MIRTTALFLIVLSVSLECSYAGDGEAHPPMCGCSGNVQVASGLSFDNLKSYGRVETEQWLNIHSEAEERRWIYVVIHHSATESGSVEGIHAEHSRRRDSAGNFWLGIGYHFVVGNGNGMPNGEVESTFRWKQQLHGAHSGSAVHNANGIGICLIGNFEKTAPTREQTAAVTQLVKSLTRRYDIPARLVIGHRTVKPTACPGRHFPLQDVVRKAMEEASI